jgi:site-specific DNA-methyltransferase (adenine-specific)
VKPYYEHAGITIYHGDCREIWPILGYGEVIICDPPYGRNCALNTSSERIAGDEDTTLRDWVLSLPLPKLIFGSPFVARPDCKMTLIWDKSELTGMGDLAFPWKMTHEEIYVIGIGFKSTRRRGSVLRFPLRPSWSNHPDSVSGLHPNEKPVSLMVSLLECCPWLEIADLTCGTGTTLQAAKRLNKCAIGIEIEERYCEIAAKRLSQEVFDFEGARG